MIEGQITLYVTPEMEVILNDLVARDNRSRSEVFRTAIALYKTVKDAQRRGLEPALIDQDGEISARLTGA